MKNTNQSWKGLTQDLFNAQLFGDTLFGDDTCSDNAVDLLPDMPAIDEMRYEDFVNLIGEEKALRQRSKKRKISNHA